ncbi:MAG: LytR family transcriptional regulator [Candidatus Improbicoccus devescovinae]|nr:MAG: LytR family transcriptional regulator [Candidatus Improbicoccus devescovinae]
MGSFNKFNRRKKLIKFKRVLLLIFFSSIGLAGLAIIYLYFYTLSFNNFNNNIIKKKSDYNPIFNTLILGLDTLATKYNGRSDSIIIISTNIDKKTIKIISLMRDIWVNIPKYGYDRLNSSYAYGGASLAASTIEQNFGINIDKYVSIDFLGFEKIINDLGGINMFLLSEEAIFINNHSKSSKKVSVGENTLDGDQTLQYARDRDSQGSDYDRTNRQRKVIKILIQKIKKNSIKNNSSLFINLLKYVRSDYKINEILNLLKALSTSSDYEISDFRLPTNDNVKNSVIDFKMVLEIPNLQKARKDIVEFILK